jgi:hypothetical protein
VAFSTTAYFRAFSGKIVRIFLDLCVAIPAWHVPVHRSPKRVCDNSEIANKIPVLLQLPESKVSHAMAFQASIGFIA